METAPGEIELVAKFIPLKDTGADVVNVTYDFNNGEELYSYDFFRNSVFNMLESDAAIDNTNIIRPAGRTLVGFEVNGRRVGFGAEVHLIDDTFIKYI